MKIFKIIYSSLLLCFLSCVVLPQHFKETGKSILEARDKRNANAIKIMYDEGRLSDENDLRTAIIAIANIADTSNDYTKLILKIYSAEEDKYGANFNTQIQSVCSFALGQITGKSSLGYLRMMEERENKVYGYSRTKLAVSILNSLGKIGDQTDLDHIIKIESASDSIRGAIALAIARFGIRKIKSPEAADKLKGLTYYIEDENQRKWVAYALNRIGDKEMLDKCKNELEFLSSSQNHFCKTSAFSALGKTGDPQFAEFMMKWYSIETDWRVKVSILNSVGNLEINEGTLSENTFIQIMHSAVDDANPNVCITACQTLAKICGRLGKSHPFSAQLRDYFEHYIAPGRAVDDYIQNELIITLAKIYKDDYKSSLFTLFSQAEGYDRKSAIVSSFQFIENPLVYKELRDVISADVQNHNILHPNKDGSMIGSPELAKMYLAFLQVLAALDDKMEEKDRNIVRLIFSEFSASKNTAITDVCLSSLTEPMYEKYREETGQVMTFDFGNFNKETDKEVMLLFIESWGEMKTESAEEILEKQLRSSDYNIAQASAAALKQITGKDHTKDIIAYKIKNDFDWTFINKLIFKDLASINTNKGVIKVRLFPDMATFTIQSFVKLGERGFYNGTIFHRVVPNFVVQGGDPTGTGYGGPGYSLRTEITDNTFDEYFVGMASSGKDTEGSQFFITHSPQPHLDGNYTIFGKVIDGFDVVDKIVIGDKITGISFSSF